jgi:PGF-pre-PGF domain-containing protein
MRKALFIPALIIFSAGVHAADCLSLDTENPPSLPMDVRGSISLNGQPAPEDTPLQAYIDKQKISEHASVEKGIFATDKDRFVLCGTTRGQIVHIRHGDIDMGEIEYRPGVSKVLDLSGKDSVPPDASIDAPDSVDVGESFKAVISASDNGVVRFYNWSTGQEGSASTFAFDEPGEKTLSAVIEDYAGNRQSVSTAVSVQPGSQGDRDDPGEGSGGSGAAPQPPDRSGTGSENTSSPQDPSYNRSTPPDREAVLSGLEAGKEVKVDTSQDSSTGSVASVSFTPSGDTDSQISVDVSGIESPPEDIEPTEGDPDYVEIEVDGATEVDVEQAQIVFSKTRSWVKDRQASPSDVVLKRYSEGRWQSLETEQISSNSSAYTFRAETPGFSVFAVAVESLSQPSAPSASCGDGVCSASETVTSCRRDCDSSLKAEARNELERANSSVDSGEKGFSTLERARELFESGDYLEAKALASEARKVNATETYRIFIPVAVFVLLLGAYIYARSRGDDDITVDQVSEQLAQLRTTMQETDIDHGDRIRIAEAIEKADTAMAEGKPGEAYSVLRNLRYDLNQSRRIND